MTATDKPTIIASKFLAEIDRKFEYTREGRDKIAGNFANLDTTRGEDVLAVIQRNSGDLAVANGKISVMEWYVDSVRINKLGDLRKTLWLIGRQANANIRRIATDLSGMSSDAASMAIEEMVNRGRARAWVEVAQEVEWMLSDEVDLIDDLAGPEAH